MTRKLTSDDIKPLGMSVSQPLLRTSITLAVILASVLLCARIAYLVWLCPYELVADEAHYWEWSRRPDLSYYTKGPGVAWLLYASTHLFDVSEWAVRLPAALASFACVILLVALTVSACPDRPRATFFAAALFMLAPVFHGTAQFMTIDGPYYACWLLAALAAWRMHRGNPSASGFLALGMVIGIGMLFKYTILLIAPGVLWFLFRHHPMTPLRRTASLLTLLAGITACASPILVWNVHNGWPTLAHLLGHAGLPGGDVQIGQEWKYSAFWTIGYILYPFLVLGPPMGILLVLAFRDAWKQRIQDPGRWVFASFALHIAAPIVVFYFLLSFKTDIELNWAVAGYTVLVIPCAIFLSDNLPATPGIARLWKWTIGFGLAMALLISFGTWPLKWLSSWEILGLRIPSESALKRVQGNKELANRVGKLSRSLARETGLKPFIVASGYSRASLLAFYLPDHPSIHCASALMGGRETAYDYFADTSLADPDLLGRPAILIGASPFAWDQALFFERLVRSASPGRIIAAYNYGGPSREPHTR